MAHGSRDWTGHPETMISRFPSRAEMPQEFLDDDDVAPLGVELRMSLVEAHFAEADVLQERAARRVLDEHTRDELPETVVRGGGAQRIHCRASVAASASIPRDIHGEF